MCKVLSGMREPHGPTFRRFVGKLGRNLTRFDDRGDVDVLVARQAILDRYGKVQAYELLFRRDRATNSFDGTEAAAATMHVLSNTVMSIGVNKLLGGKKAFVNFDYALLAANMHRTMPPELIMIEILETVEPTEALVELCRSIRREGYTLAMDDYAGAPNFEALANVVDVIKVDIRLSSREEQAGMIAKYKPKGIVMLAEKVETQEEYAWARDAGYSLFQGYFFARPVMVRSKRIPANQASRLRLLREGQRAELEFEGIETLISTDVSLTYMLLRYVNSAAFARRQEIQSIRSALIAIGENALRRWITIVTLPALASTKPSELVTLSLVRARFCEQLAELCGAACSDKAFLIGIFSLLEALIDEPLESALRSLDLCPEVTNPLLGLSSENDALGGLYKLIICYEMGQWDEVCELATRLKIPQAAVGAAYLESTAWAAEAMTARGA